MKRLSDIQPVRCAKRLGTADEGYMNCLFQVQGFVDSPLFDNRYVYMEDIVSIIVVSVRIHFKKNTLIKRM